MQTEINALLEQLKNAYEGDPWFGRNGKLLLSKVEGQTAFVKLNGQHSILELVWHMITWREFVIHCLQPLPGRSLEQFKERDWRDLDHTNASLWAECLQKLDETQEQLIRLIGEKGDTLLEQNVPERTYNYRKLLTGIIQHDIYHLGQIAFITKQINGKA